MVRRAGLEPAKSETPVLQTGGVAAFLPTHNFWLPRQDSNLRFTAYNLLGWNTYCPHIKSGCRRLAQLSA